jgi:hypothetical protein
MNCAYHIGNNAVVNCYGCGKYLCPACDHRIKGFPYCQDCIVTGVELLQRQVHSGAVPLVKKQASPFVATFLSMLCPGLGAAYNGQTAKALTFFAVFVGLFQLAVTTHNAPIFVFGFMGTWLYAAVDAWRTAQMIRSGVTPSGAEDILMKRLSGNPALWGGILIVLGLTFVMQMLGFTLPIRQLLPAIFIGMGAYLLWSFWHKRSDRQQQAHLSDMPPQHMPHASGEYYRDVEEVTAFRTGEFSDPYAQNRGGGQWRS